MTDFDARLDLVPASPGVYLMKDGAGKIIYAGKARRLRQRLRSYFGPGGPQGGEKVRVMVEHIRDFSFVLCQNELEALVLESNLIKRYQPFYNILLKDDRDYPYLRITMQEAYPRILKAYRIGPDSRAGAKYYGPFLNGDLNRALKTIHELFPLKTCRRVFPRDIGKERPCLNYYIHRCIGPCRGDVPQARYREIMDEVCDFLEGRYSVIIKQAKESMAEASAALDFEAAAVWRDRLRHLERLRESQVAVTGYKSDTDVLGLALARDSGCCCVVRLELRDGKVSGTTTHFLKENGEPEGELLLAFITQYYDWATVPRQLLVPVLLKESERAAAESFLEGKLRERREAGAGALPGDSGAAGAFADSAAADDVADVPGALAAAEQGPHAYDQRAAGVANDAAPLRYTRVSVSFAQRGDKIRLIDMARRTAGESLLRRNLREGGAESARAAALTGLARLVGMSGTALGRIEAYDIANYGGNDKSCGMIVFEDGKSKKSAYRLFRIKRVEGQDDYASMREALERRLDHLETADFGPAPQLLLLDGGRQHVALGVEILRERGLDLALAGMVKDARHRTRGLALPDGRMIELAALAEGSASGTSSSDVEVGAAEAQAVLRLLTRIQDEAHRFAGQYMRKLSHKRQIRYKLEAIPGVGPKRREALLRAFPSVKAVSEASVEELLNQAPTLGKKAAEAVFGYFHPETEQGFEKRQKQ